MKYKVGDRCVVLPAVNQPVDELDRRFTGKTVTLVRYEGSIPWNPWPDFWVTDLETPYGPVLIAEVRLEKLPPREELGSWEELREIWNPERELA